MEWVSKSKGENEPNPNVVTFQGCMLHAASIPSAFDYKSRKVGRSMHGTRATKGRVKGRIFPDKSNVRDKR